MKRFLSVILAIAICLTFIGSAFAATTGDVTEYVYNFVPVGVDTALYKTPASRYTDYGSTQLNTDWKYIDGSITANGTPNLIIFNGLTLDGFGKGDWLALKLRVPKAGIYSFDYYYYTASSYNSGEIYLASDATAPANYCDSKNFLATVNHNATKEEQKNIKFTDKVLAVNSDNQEFIFIMKRTKTAPNVARKIVLTKISDAIPDFAAVTLTPGESSKITMPLSFLAASDAVTYESSNASVAAVDANGNITAKDAGNATITVTAGDVTKEIPVAVKQAFTYSFLPAEYGTAGTDDYLNVSSGMAVKAANTYTDSGLKLNWKYDSMHPEFETSYDTWSGGSYKLAGISNDYGLKFSPRAGDQWLAIRLRVPESGIYEISYKKGVDTSYATKGDIYMFPDGQEIDFSSEYRIASEVNFTSGTGYQTTGRQLTATSNNQEFVFVLKNASDARVTTLALKEIKLTKVSDVPTKKVYITAPEGVTLTNVSNAVQDSQIDVAEGKTVTATAPETAGAKTFKYWKDLSSGSVYSTNTKVSFMLASNTSLMAVYAEKPDGKFLVEFANANREILMSEYLATGDAITAPALPSLTGYGEAKEWSAYPEVVSDADVQSIAHYDAPKAVSITVTGGTADKDSYTYNDKVTVTANDEESFVCWERDGKVVSYSPEYSFYAWSDATLTAVTEGSKSSAPSVILDSDVRSEGGAAAYMMELVNTENYTVLEYGILFGGSDLDLTKDTVYKASAVTKSSTQFCAMVPDANGIEAVRAYVVYYDGLNIKTIYSDTVSK